MSEHTKECHHGWRGTVPVDGERIVTPCPHCGCQSLFIGSGGHLTCSRVPSRGSDGCGNPSVADAVEKLKRDREDLVAALRRARPYLDCAVDLITNKAAADEHDCDSKQVDELLARFAQ